MCEDINDCDCHHGHHGRHQHHKRGYSSLIKRTSKTVEVPAELLEVAEIKEGDFLKIRIHRVMKPSERKKHNHHKD